MTTFCSNTIYNIFEQDRSKVSLLYTDTVIAFIYCFATMGYKFFKCSRRPHDTVGMQVSVDVDSKPTKTF